MLTRVPQNNLLTIWLAVWSIYCMDFSINGGKFFHISPYVPTTRNLTRPPVQAVDRALLVDTFPRTEQETGNAWAAIMQGVGGVGGFFL